MLKDWVKTGIWISRRIHPLSRMKGKTLGIIGFGNIGSRVLKKMAGFGMDILVCDPYLPKKRLKVLSMKHAPFDEVLRKSDIITIHVPVTGETRGMFNIK